MTEGAAHVKANGLCSVIAAIVIAGAAGCGGSGALSAAMAPGATAAAPPPQPQVHTQSLDTAQVLEQARSVSNTASPYAVDDGALKLTDTSDSSDPIAVDTN
jgi:hypothetical protein